AFRLRERLAAGSACLLERIEDKKLPADSADVEALGGEQIVKCVLDVLARHVECHGCDLENVRDRKERAPAAVSDPCADKLRAEFAARFVSGALVLGEFLELRHERLSVGDCVFQPPGGEVGGGGLHCDTLAAR